MLTTGYGGFSKSVGRQEVEMILTVEMLQTWHGDSLYHLAEGRRHKGQCLRHPAIRALDKGERRVDSATPEGFR
jgi:hypothetical protein